MTYINSEFPIAPGFGTKGGPGFSTSVTRLSGGAEKRNQRFTYPLGAWEVVLANAKASDFYPLQQLFMAAQGKTHSFPFKDYFDFISGAPGSVIAFDDSVIGTGDGVETEFQIVKRYVFGAQTFDRKITRPVSGTVKSGVDGVEKTITTEWTVDVTTGLVTYVTPPGDGLVVTAGFEFRVPCRFDIDRLPVVASNVTVNDGPVITSTVPLTEVRE